MKKRMFLVDSENISDYNFIDINNINQHDEVIIFASKVSKSIKVNCLERILSSNAKISFEWVETGTKNELDFQLVAYLALNLNQDIEHYVVSRDCGFSSAINYIKKQCPNSNIELITENQKLPINVQDSKNKKTTDKVQGNSDNILENVESSLTVLKSPVLRKRAKKVVKEWIKGTVNCSQARANLKRVLYSFGLNGKVNESLCTQIIDSNKELIENARA